MKMRLLNLCTSRGAANIFSLGREPQEIQSTTTDSRGAATETKSGLILSLLRGWSEDCVRFLGLTPQEAQDTDSEAAERRQNLTDRVSFNALRLRTNMIHARG